MTVVHGFRLEREQEIKELRIHARFYKHVKTRAELLSLINDDENKVFGITFRTPPTDSTGVPHILEHSVLCGSRKYPLKEPFVELLKGSLKTFLNAFTYPDKTCYPVASQNAQDFYNLVDVYLDAVFYPRITPFILQQEGWHLELENPEDTLIYKGVVFNEMKGAYSSPERVVSEYSQHSLFPDNAYCLDSGGDPKAIPDLTFEQFKAFHKRYYHPSNARIWFYGDDDPDERLRLINEYLKGFDSIEIDSAVRLQPSFLEPKQMVRAYMAGKEIAEAKGMITLNWLLPETTDVLTNFGLRILAYILLGMPGSPLRKALIDSGMGEDLAGVGLENELRQLFFSTGLKGIDMANEGHIESLIMETLGRLAREGIDPQTVEAALNTVEFRLRENNAGSFPRGLILMQRALTTWLYDGDPMALLAFEEPLEKIKEAVGSGSGLFEQMLDRFFVSNPHRTTVIFKPDPGLRQKVESDEKDRLARIRSEMDQNQLDEIMENTRELKRIQETPDTPEALSTIPTLRLEDLNKENKIIPLEFVNRQGTPILVHDIFTNGIAYLDIGLNLHTLPVRLIPYVPLFGRALVEIGTEKEDFVTLTQRISRQTGGIRPQSFTSSTKEGGKGVAWLFLRGKAMTAQIDKLVSILCDVLLDVRLDNRDRFKQMVLEEKARHEQALVSNGHQMVLLRLCSHFGEAAWAAEQMGGISYLYFLGELAEAVDQKWPEVLADLLEIKKILVNRKTMISNITLDEAGYREFEPHIDGLLSALPKGDGSESDWSTKTPAALNEGLTIPSQVNYVGKGANLYASGYQFHGSSMVIARYLRNTWLWDRVRVQGGAYGAFCVFDRYSGVLCHVSYRDPNLIKTLDVYDETARYLMDMKMDEGERVKSIIGAIGEMDTHMLPDINGYTSMIRHLIGETDAFRQQMRDEVLGTRISDFHAFGRVLKSMKEGGLVKVLGSPSAVEAVASDRPGWLDVVKVL